jgi:ribosomal protein S18 acetylase RimI-like enzyme
MLIRPYKDKDYFEVYSLLSLCEVEPPAKESDFKGVCYVAQDEQRIIGVIWALVGVSTQAHIDYFAVHPEYQKTHIGWNLVKTMENTLKKMGIHLYTFHLEADNDEFLELIEKYQAEYNFERLRDLRTYRRTFK